MPITRSTTGGNPVNPQGDKQVSDALLSMDHVCVLGSGSRLECHSKSSMSSKKAKAALQLAELKQKQVEIDNELRLAAIKNEVEMAKLQVTLAEETDTEDCLSGEDGGEEGDMKRYLDDCRDQVNCKNANPVHVTTTTKAKGKMDLPKVEMCYFDGEPANYWMFIRQFDLCVETQLDDPGERLLYLTHYCKGKAKDAIKGCIMLPSIEGYTRAREILQDRFGQPHRIARALIDGVLEDVKPPFNSAESLEELATKMQNCEIALTQMNYHADLNSLTTLERIVRKLPLNLQEHWAVRADVIMQMKREPKFGDLTVFIVEKARLSGSRFGQVVRDTEQRQSKVVKQQFSHKVIERSPQPFGSFLISKSNEPGRCEACDDMHELSKCPEFVKMSVSARWELLKRTGRCFQCMNGMHNASGCRTSNSCGEAGCRGRHHRMLHVDKGATRTEYQHKESRCVATVGASEAVCLGTIPIRVKGPLGEIETVAFLDNGSDITLVRSDILKRLGITSHPSNLTINTITSSSVISSRRCQLELKPAVGSSTVRVDEAYAVNSLPIRITSCGRKQIASSWPHLRDIPFTRSSSNEVTVLVGCNVPEAHWVIEQRIGDRTQPFATKTVLGWALHGPVNTGHRASVNIVNEVDPTTNALQRMYDSEFADVNREETCLSLDEAAALQIVSESTTFVNGHYSVPLPWKSAERVLPNNYPLAVKRLECLRKKLASNVGLHHKYKEVMDGHIRKGYAVKIEPVDVSSKNQPLWYLPHHAVLNPKKPGKVRVVFDCAARWGERSLNDYLYSGPDTTSNLVGILMRFRLRAIAVAADIEEMFLQVKVPERDQNALRFLWWPDGDSSQPHSEYRLTRHPFGATSSPFCANYALRKAVEKFEMEREMQLGEVATTYFYVDDLLTSFADTKTALEFSSQLTTCLGNAGFRLRKWISNHKSILNHVPDSRNENAVMRLTDGSVPCDKALGIAWDTDKDELRFEFQVSNVCRTRREILSCVSTLFDPLGLIAPMLLPAKFLLQKLCRNGLGWDDVIDGENLREWQRWVESMKQVCTIEIPRWCQGVNNNTSSAQLHIFCDASERGYGAVAYGRYHTANGTRCSLLYGKARVAPLKVVTIPRLELTAAVLAVRVCRIIVENLKEEFGEVYFWTDSMIVLYYIGNVESRFSTFVANRLAIIREYSDFQQWHHIGSHHNPADKVSRGAYAHDKSMSLWFNGPDFLKMPQSSWPEQPSSIKPPEQIEHKSSTVKGLTMCMQKTCTPLFTHYSDWFNLAKAIAWMLRYKDYLLLMTGVRANNSLLTGPLRAKELEYATLNVIKLVQRETLSREIDLLNRYGRGEEEAYKQLVKESYLRRLSPILVDGIVRVGGRLNCSSYDMDVKHPIILPGGHVVTELIVKHYHAVEGHCGPMQLLAAIRRRYWIVKGKMIIRRVVSQCPECKRRSVTVGRQMMAPLPKERVTAGWRAFKLVGIDFFGPIPVKRGRSMEKRYGCLFTCLQIRAVHIEVTHELSTDAFLMALMRFMGRRGAPSDIYSDNGSGFVGADSELKAGLAKFSHDKINDKLLRSGVQWHFNPPFASHRGGVWERMIKSVKRILNVVCKEQTINDEMLLTLMIEAERVLNSRPIVSANSDHKDALALTPNDLILLHDNSAPLTTDNLQQRYGKCWKRVNYLASVFWNRWTSEYLPTLQIRQKWLIKDRNFRIGDVVLVLSEPKTFGKWPLGRITRCEVDGDGLVRTVTVRTAGRELRRDVRKVSLLEGVE